jgi:hypothetical protein
MMAIQTAHLKKPCAPAKAGAHLLPVQGGTDRRWVPAFAGTRGFLEGHPA